MAADVGLNDEAAIGVLEGCISKVEGGSDVAIWTQAVPCLCFISNPRKSQFCCVNRRYTDVRPGARGPKLF